MESKSPMKDYWFGKRAGEQADGWYEFFKAVDEQGVLDPKTKELIAVAAGTLMRCRHCCTMHVAAAKKAGASKEEIAEAIMVAAMIASGSQLFWLDDYEKLLGE